jgi:hypothetical protein
MGPQGPSGVVAANEVQTPGLITLPYGDADTFAAVLQTTFAVDRPSKVVLMLDGLSNYGPNADPCRGQVDLQLRLDGAAQPDLNLTSLTDLELREMFDVAVGTHTLALVGRSVPALGCTSTNPFGASAQFILYAFATP